MPLTVYNCLNCGAPYDGSLMCKYCGTSRSYSAYLGKKLHGKPSEGLINLEGYRVHWAYDAGTGLWHGKGLNAVTAVGGVFWLPWPRRMTDVELTGCMLRKGNHEDVPFEDGYIPPVASYELITTDSPAHVTGKLWVEIGAEFADGEARLGDES